MLIRTDKEPMLTYCVTEHLVIQQFLETIVFDSICIFRKCSFTLEFMMLHQSTNHCTRNYDLTDDKNL